MSLVRPHPVEREIEFLKILQADRPRYYDAVVQTTKNIFYLLGFDGSNPDFEDKVTQLNNMIVETIEIPFEASFTCVVMAFDSPRHFGSRKAYTVIGEGVDAIEVTKFHIEMRLNYIKEWCYREVYQLTPYVRFTQRATV